LKINSRSLFFKIFFGLWATLMLFAITPIIIFLVGNQDNRNTFYSISKKEIEKNIYMDLRRAADSKNLDEIRKLVKKVEENLAVKIYIFDSDRKEIDNKLYPQIIEELINEMQDGKVVLIKKIANGENHGRVIRVIKNHGFTMVSYPSGKEKLPNLLMIMAHHIHIFLYILLLSSVASLIIARYFIKPLVTLSKASREIAEGDFTVRVSDKVKSKDEIGILAKDFDIMAAKLEQNRENQESMLRNISHELRSPLTRLRLSLELARGKADQSTYPALNRIEKESDRLNEMIGKLLEISRIKAHDDMLREDVNISEVVSPVIRDCNFEATETGKKLSSNISDCIIKANSEMFASSIENILRNAIKYAENNVTITSCVDTDKLVLSISDDGCGVPKEHLVNIFTPFYRVQDDRDRKTGGTGLGLAIAKTVIEAHNGTIFAENNDFGGLKITIYIPTA